VTYTLTYRQPLLFAGESVLFTGSTVTHQAVATVMNEPYPDATNTTPCPT
jgi:hypothetical protein